MALVKLLKRPTSRHLARRTVSFKATGEIDHVRPNDDVVIEIATPTGTTYVNMKGKDFLRKLTLNKAKDGTKILVLGF